MLIPPSTSGVERGFSVMFLLVSPLRISLNESNIDRFMGICLDGPKFLSKEQLGNIIDIYKDKAPPYDSTQNFSLMFFVVIFHWFVLWAMFLDLFRSFYWYVMRCTIWYNLYNLKNVKNTHGGVLLLVKLTGLFLYVLKTSETRKSLVFWCL